MNECEYYQELISLLIDGEITAEEKSSLGRHIQVCRECAGLYCAFRSMSDMFSEDLAEPPEGLSGDIMKKLRRSGKRKKTVRKNKIIYLKRFAAVAACAAILCIAAFAVPELTSGSKKTAAASVAAAYGIDAGLYKTESAVLAEEAAPAEEVMPVVDTSNSAEDRVKAAAQPTPVNVEALGDESSTPAVDLTGRGLGNKLSSYFSGSECDLPTDRNADRTVFIYYDPDGITGEVLVKVYGERVYYINLSGEESTAHLASCTWSQLSPLIK